MRDTKVINFYRYKNSFTVENFQAYVQVESIPTLVSSFNTDQVRASYFLSTLPCPSSDEFKFCEHS